MGRLAGRRDMTAPFYSKPGTYNNDSTESQKTHNTTTSMIQKGEKTNYSQTKERICIVHRSHLSPFWAKSYAVPWANLFAPPSLGVSCVEQTAPSGYSRWAYWRFSACVLLVSLLLWTLVQPRGSSSAGVLGIHKPLIFYGPILPAYFWGVARLRRGGRGQWRA